MLRIFNPLTDPEMLEQFHQAVRAQWVPQAPAGPPPEPARGAALARLLSPFRSGARQALLGAARLVPAMARARCLEQQLMLTTVALDAARHLVALERVYRWLGQPPLPVRALPEWVAFHAAARQGPVPWLWALLVGSHLAAATYRALAAALPPYPWAALADDAGRHSRFAAAALLRHGGGAAGGGAVPRALLAAAEATGRRLLPEAAALGLDGGALWQAVRDQAQALVEQMAREGKAGGAEHAG